MMSEEDTIDREALEPTCAAVLEEAAAYVLGSDALSAPTRLHLLKCPTCQQKLSEYQAVRRLLPLAAPTIEPPAALRDRILVTVAETQAAKNKPAMPAPAPKELADPQPIRHKPAPAWSLIISLITALSLLLMMISWNVVLQEDVSRQDIQLSNSREAWDTLIVLMNDPNIRVVKLNGTATHGTLWSVPSRDRGCLMLENLPPLAQGQRYQVWLNNQGQWVSGGLFQGRDGKSWFIAKPGQSFDHFTQIVVTVEPNAGSPQPKGPIVVQGSL